MKFYSTGASTIFEHRLVQRCASDSVGHSHPRPLPLPHPDPRPRPRTPLASNSSSGGSASPHSDALQPIGLVRVQLVTCTCCSICRHSIVRVQMTRSQDVVMPLLVVAALCCSVHGAVEVMDQISPRSSITILIVSRACPFPHPCQADEVKALPGWSKQLPSKHYSGYIPVANGTKHMHCE